MKENKWSDYVIELIDNSVIQSLSYFYGAASRVSKLLFSGRTIHASYVFLRINRERGSTIQIASSADFDSNIFV